MYLYAPELQDALQGTGTTQEVAVLLNPALHSHWQVVVVDPELVYTALAGLLVQGLHSTAVLENPTLQAHGQFMAVVPGPT